ncbi:MAG TPA: energy transducer TonB [Ferruginibacter sp.]|nr:energy transducer TonB [Ferruginibacter sp.]
MNKETIMQADVLDIIFENRNKSYGAYDLRKFYNARLTKAILFTVATMLVLSAFTFLPSKKKNRDDGMITTKPVFIPKAPEKKVEPEKPKTPPQQQAAKTASVQPTSNPVIVKDVEVPKISAITDSTVISARPSTGTPGNGPAIVQPVITDPGGGGTDPVKPVVDKTTPTFTAEVMPEFPGGMPALYKFLKRNLQNPQDVEEGQTISVKVQFVVGYDGKLQRFQTIEDGGEAFNNEVLRVLKKMPDWIPGKTNGENVSVYYTIPVKFVAEQ